MKRNILLLTLCFFLSFSSLFAQDKPAETLPNIVWIVCEDLSPHLGSYGEKVAKTPILDQLAKESVRYTQAYSTAGVCAPSRSALITGNYQTSIGSHNMRTLGTSASPSSDYPIGLNPYSAVIPEGVKCFPEYLRIAGYYCTNNAKEDYQFVAPVTAWDESSKKAHWRNRPDKTQPFFSVFNLETTHESQVWARDKEPLLVDPKTVEVPPYYPDDSISRQVIARFLSNVMVMDKQVGEIIQQLKDDGLYDNTILFFYSDHGDGLPFVKRELHHRGLKVPLLIKAPFLPKGTTDDQLVSFVDFGPTILSLAGIPIPKTMQWQAFLGTQQAESKRKYIFAARDRMDSEYDRVRSVSDGRFNYLRNYMPEKPYYQNINYRLKNPLMANLLTLKKGGHLNQKQLLWFRPNKVEEELFDTQNDPYEFENLASNPEYASKLAELREEHEKWTKNFGDLGAVNEIELVKNWWGGQAEAPKTAEPEIRMEAGYVTISCQTAGASIGYRTDTQQAWKVYTEPFLAKPGEKIFVTAQRIGYQASSKIEAF